MKTTKKAILPVLALCLIGSAFIAGCGSSGSGDDTAGDTAAGDTADGDTGGSTVYGAGAYVCFGRALGYMNESWVDVHGAGAQRSDPKGGDPADFPTGCPEYR